MTKNIIIAVLLVPLVFALLLGREQEKLTMQFVNLWTECIRGTNQRPLNNMMKGELK